MAAVFHQIGFVVPKALLEGMETALADYFANAATELLERLLAAAWSKAATRLATKTDSLGEDRQVLRERLVGFEAIKAITLLDAVPEIVRRSVRDDVLRRSRLLAAMVELGGGPLEGVLEAGRADLEALIGALDPTSKMPAQCSPKLIPYYPHSSRGDEPEGILPHHWVGEVLEYTRDPDAQTVVRREVARTKRKKGDADVPMRPGIDQTSFGLEGTRSLWVPPEVRLPRNFDDGRSVAGEAGGPLTYALAGDRLGRHVEPALALRARDLGAEDALVSFMWRKTDVFADFHTRP